MGHKPELTPKKAARYRELAAAREGMSEIAAFEEAQRRWGESGVAWFRAYWKPGEAGRCAVGAQVGEVRDEWQIFGTGKDFETAFRDAEARGH